MCPLPQITSLPVSRKEQLALPEVPRRSGLSADKFGREWKTLQRVGGIIGGSSVPIGPKGVAMQGRGWTQCRCEPLQETGQVSRVFRRPGPGVPTGSLHYGGSCHGGGGLWALGCVWDGGHVRSRRLRSACWDLDMVSECSGAGA